jgi:hypothetical protein
MGYDTYAHGHFTLREPYPDCLDLDKKKVDTELHNIYMEDVEWADDKSVYIRTGEMHMYASKEEMQVIAKFLNGKLECEGEDQGDVYDLIFKDGKIFIQRYMTVKDGPEKENVDEELGWS